MNAPVQGAFGQWLKQRRHDTGLTQDDLANAAACSEITVQKIEAGARRPSRQIALILADLLQIPADEHEAFVTFARATRTPPTPSVGSAARATAPAPAPPQLANAAAPAPWRAAHLRQSNLPQALAPFIGREVEEQAVRALLLQPQVRLLTLTGTPGIGKTRLALEVAAGAVVAEHFADGVYLVELAPITEPALVMPAIAQSLGLQESGGLHGTFAAPVLQYLRDKRLLLVLDNFEQVLDAAPDVVQLIQASPWLKVLATSREALHVKGERRFSVPPFPLPAQADPLDLESLAHSPAVAFFVERAQDAQPDFVLTAENAADVAAVCAGLDGLPLAIELAAARANLLSARQMREALSSRLKLSNQGTRDLPARHQTLRRAIDWSYDLLDAGEQQLFQRMAVFEGGSAQDAIAGICTAEGAPGIDVANELESLLRKNLLKQRPGVGGALRFWMLETIHEYGGEKLEESGELDALRCGHAAYFLAFAERAEPLLRGPEQVEWMDCLDEEHNNLQAALRWAVECDEVGIGLRLAGALYLFWDQRGYWAVGLQWLNATLALGAGSGNGHAGATTDGGGAVGTPCDAQGTLRARAKALLGAGALARWSQSVVMRRAYLDECLGICRQQKDNALASHALHLLSALHSIANQQEPERACVEEGLALSREAGDKPGTARGLERLGFFALRDGDYSTARPLLEQSLGLYTEMADKYGICHLLRHLTALAIYEGDYAAARTVAAQGLAMAHTIKSKMQVGWALDLAGLLERQQGNYPAARLQYEAELAVWRDLGSTAAMCSIVSEIAYCLSEEGHYSKALDLYRESLTMRRGLTEPQGQVAETNKFVLSCIIDLARVAGAQQQLKKAARLLGAAGALIEVYYPTKALFVGYSYFRLMYERYLGHIDAIRQELGEAGWKEVAQEGSAMRLEEAIAYALEAG